MTYIGAGSARPLIIGRIRGVGGRLPIVRELASVTVSTVVTLSGRLGFFAN